MSTKSNSIMDHPDSEQPTAVSDSEELIAKLDNEALLAKFLDVNANFIAVGPLARQFQDLRYSQLRDELYRIDLQIRRRALLGTHAHKAAVKAAHGSGMADRSHSAPQRPQFSSPRKPDGRSAVTGSRRATGPCARLHKRGSPRQPEGRSATRGPAPRDGPPPRSPTGGAPRKPGGGKPAAPAARGPPPPAPTTTVPSRTILAAWRAAIFPFAHPRPDPQ